MTRDHGKDQLLRGQFPPSRYTQNNRAEHH
jgi:hypothetical protein